MEEIWKDIPNYDGYQVSNLGNVRSYNKITFTNKHGKRHWKNRNLKQKVTSNKRGRKDCRVELWQNGKHKTLLVARLIAFTFFEEKLESDLTVNHIDGNTLNNNLSNLEIITRKENIQKGFKTGLYDNTIKKVKLIDKNEDKVIDIGSMSYISSILNHNKGYISSKIKKNKFENKDYKWEMI